MPFKSSYIWVFLTVSSANKWDKTMCQNQGKLEEIENLSVEIGNEFSVTPSGFKMKFIIF
jgi:hypothetical protein